MTGIALAILLSMFLRENRPRAEERRGCLGMKRSTSYWHAFFCPVSYRRRPPAQILIPRRKIPIWPAQVKALREALLQRRSRWPLSREKSKRWKAQSKDGATLTVTNEPTPSPSEIPAADPSTSSVEPSTKYAGANSKHRPSAQELQEIGKSEQVPLGSFRIGDAILELGGFVDLENIFRTTNTQSNIATNLGGFPYNNTQQGRISEFRTTAQFSRLSFKIQDHFAGNDILGFVEGDFSGNDAPGVYQSVNPHTNRLRLTSWT